MEEREILQCLSDQRLELNQYGSDVFIERKECDQIDLDSRLAQVVTGVRRSGKSTLCHMALRKKKVEYGYVNFDDDRLADLKVRDLNLVLTCIYRLYGTNLQYLFFDEIQNVDGWHLFINRLLRQGHKILITGSNAKLLSSELSTHLTGRYNEIKLFPFSFKEFCQKHGVDTNDMTTKNVAVIKNAMDSYLMEGGFPELPEIKNKRGYIDGLVNTIISKDISLRYRLRNQEGLKTLAYHLINNVAQFIDVVSMSTDLGIGVEKTVRNYIEYLSQAYLILPLSKFSYKSRVRLRNEKAYVVDNGMFTYHEHSLSPSNLGWRLENVVYIELLRRSGPLMHEIYYYRPTPRSPEVDFVITDRGNVMELIQVSYDIGNEKTFKREVKALVDASRKTGCENLLLITLDRTETLTYEGKTIKIISAMDWLLND